MCPFGGGGEGGGGGGGGGSCRARKVLWLNMSSSPRHARRSWPPRLWLKSAGKGGWGHATCWCFRRRLAFGKSTDLVGGFVDGGARREMDEAVKLRSCRKSKLGQGQLEQAPVRVGCKLQRASGEPGTWGRPRNWRCVWEAYSVPSARPKIEGVWDRLRRWSQDIPLTST